VEAENWVRWARTPGHDGYWYYRDSFFEAIVPRASGLTLEVGCGEDRVARDLSQRAHRVVAVDSSRKLIRYAKEADPAGSYLLADAAALPFPAGAFELVVAYNSLMDVEDLEAAVHEAARVLSAEGRLCICVTHPLFDAGGFASDDGDAPFVIEGSYLAAREFHESVERSGLQITFHGYCYPLQDYARALEDAGFLIERLREPRPRPEHVAEHPSWKRGQRVPTFLHLRCRKSQDS
jgi:SAM-dependent methyltransferase